MDQDATQPAEELPKKLELVGAKGPITMRVVVPRSLAERFELLYAAGPNPHRAYAAALHRCCGPVRKAVRDTASVADLGKAVLDHLLEQGVPFPEIVGAGQVAWLHCVRDLPDLEAARSAAGFSGPSAVDSTG